MTKRRRHHEPAPTAVANAPTVVEPSKDHAPSRRQTHILDLPLEVLVQVLRLCSYRHVAESIRLVCRKLREASGLALEAALGALDQHIDCALVAADAAVHSAPTHYNMETYARVYGALEIVQAQYRLLCAVTWRYRGFFYAGRLLLDIENVLRNAVNVPRSVAFRFQPQSAPSAVPDRVAFESSVERFMVHFEKHTERLLNNGPSVSGARVVDLLDCLIRGPECSNSETSEGRYRLRASYRLPRCWFCCLHIGESPTVAALASAQPPAQLGPGADWAVWRDASRFLYLRVRRLVAACNRHELQARHAERELLLQMGRAAPTPPRPDAYSGVGVHPPYFFFYGSLNKTAYATRFENVEAEPNAPGSPEASPEPADNSLQASSARRRPLPDLLVTVELDCAPWQAPLSARRREGALGPTTLTSGSRTPFVLALEFRCERARADRLPGICRFLVSDDGAGDPTFQVNLMD